MATNRSRNTLTDRPLSVYDNLTVQSTNNNNNYQHNRHHPEPPTFPFPDISFKFDDDQAPMRSQPIDHRNGVMENQNVNMGSRIQYSTPQPINDQNSPDMYTMTSPSHSAAHIRYDHTNDHHHNASPDDHPHHHQNMQQNRLNHQSQPQQQQQTPHNYYNHYHHPNNNNSNNVNSATTSVTKPIAQYENVAETIKLRNSFRATKPVISDAKSSFFGLDTPKLSSSSPSSQSYLNPDQSYPNTMDQHDRAPLILGAPSVVPTKSNGEYQNIPSNSAFFHHRIPAPSTTTTEAPPHQSLPSQPPMGTTWNHQPPSAAATNASPSGSNMSTRSVSAASSPPKSPTNDLVDGCQLGVVDERDHNQRLSSDHNPSQVSCALKKKTQN